MDEISETDHLFATRTVDEVATYCRETQKDIAKTQEELRSLIGQKYRELLDCCDLVVGMDDVCEQIQRRWTNLKTTATQPSEAYGRGSAANKGQRGGVPSMNTGHSASPAVGAAVDVHRQAYAAVLLLREGHFRRAVLEYKQASSHIGDTANLAMAPPLIQTAARVAELVPSTLRDAMRASIASLALMPSTKSAMDVYDDLHGALGDLSGKSRAEVVTEMVDMHLSALEDVLAQNDSAKAMGTKVGLLTVRCVSYVRHHATNTVAIAPSLPQASTLEQLLALDHRAPGFEDRLRMELCQRGALAEPLDGGAAALNGWMSPIPLQQPALDATPLYARIFTQLESLLRKWCTTLGSARRISPAESAFLDATKSLAWTVNDDDVIRRVNETASKVFASSLVDLCTKNLNAMQQAALQEIKEAAAAEKPSSPTTTANRAQTRGGATTDIQNAVLQQIVNKTSTLLHVKAPAVDVKKKQSVSQQASKDLATAWAEVVSDVHMLYAKTDGVAQGTSSSVTPAYRAQLDEHLLQVIKAVADACRRALLATRTSSSLSDETKVANALRVANIASAVVDPLKDTSAAPFSGTISQAVGDCQRVIQDLHEPWTNVTVAAVLAGAREGVRELLATDDARFERKLRWNVAERAEHPIRPSSWVVTALLDLRRVGALHYGTSYLTQREFEWLGVQFSVQVEKSCLDLLRSATLRPATNFAAIQLWFDASCITAALNPTALDKVSAALRHEVAVRVDPVILAIAEPSMAAAVAESNLSTGVGLGIVMPARRSDVRPKAEARRMPQARDGQRITNVPLPTAPKPVNRVAAAALGTPTSGDATAKSNSGNNSSATAASGAALLRGFISGWTS